MTKGKKRINPPGKKFCSRCEETKPLEEFPLAKRSHDGRFTYCTPCTRERNRERTPEQRRAWHIKSKYGLEVAEYDALLAKQGGLCAICKQPPTANTRTTALPLLAVDHCHSTGAVRGLLCFNCNTGLGSFQDSGSLLTAAMTYLQHPPVGPGAPR